MNLSLTSVTPDTKSLLLIRACLNAQRITFLPILARFVTDVMNNDPVPCL